MGSWNQQPLEVRPPEADETYSDYLACFGLFNDTSFVYRELVRPNDPRHATPPRSLWPRMVPTLRLAIELRERMLCAGARGLVVHAAYRPAGGEADSQHKHNAALDLDLLADDVQRDAGLPALFAQIAAVLWNEARQLRVGCGTYAAEGHETTRRVHIDTGLRWRCWQGVGTSGSGRALFSVKPAVLRLAKLEPSVNMAVCIASRLDREEP